jgi:hypothetical protein
MKLKKKLQVLGMLMRAHNAAHHFRHFISGNSMCHCKRSTPNMKLFAFAIFAHSIAAFAVGTMAIGSIVCGHMSLKKGKIDSLKINDLIIKNLKVENKNRS